MRYVIIQAGGKGSRLEKYTYNKPKALLSVDSLPMIFHTFELFSDARFVIIGDYKYDVLQKYLQSFSSVDYVLIKAGGTGTCAGISDALRFIPNGEEFLLIWCDLVLSKTSSLRSIEGTGNYVGISKDFECRWSYIDGEFIEEKSKEHGVAGFFIFDGKEQIADVPQSGEFVKYLKYKNIVFKEFPLYGTKEFGLTSEYEKYIFSKRQSRPFNEVVIDDDRVVKIPLDTKGRELAEYETGWYKFVAQRGYDNIPRVYSFEPLTLERIDGFHPFELKDANTQTKKRVIDIVLDSYEKLHGIDEPVESDKFSLEKEYYTKTFERLGKVYRLVPFATDKEIKINGRWYINPFFIEEDIKNLARRYYADEFCVIHGDPTFSNIMISKSLEKVYLIDPRGYFGYSKIYGDRDYDYAKLYYSLVGNYDAMNQRHFTLRIDPDGVNLEIESNGYEELEEYFFDRIGWGKREKIKFLHAIIWLSLTTYAWDDYDSICTAFYNGTMKLGESI